MNKQANKEKDTSQRLKKYAEEQRADAETEAREQERAQAERDLPPVICLGRDGREFVFYSPLSRHLSRLTAEKINWPNMLDIAPRGSWERYLFPKETEADAAPPRRELVAEAQERLINESRYKSFSPDAVRARGVWPDGENGWIFNSGEKCYHMRREDSSPQVVDNVRGAYVYTTGKHLPRPDAKKLTNAEGAQVLDLFMARPWKTPYAGELLAGWAIASLLAGSMPICPHIWLTSPRGTGKTSLKADLMRFFGAFCDVAMDKIPSEPGLRQKIKGDCMPVLIDEAEPEKLEKCEPVISLIRSASYGENVYTGTIDGNGRAFWVKCCILLLSTVNGIERETDSSRFFVLALKRVNNATLADLKKRLAEARKLVDGEHFQARLIARLLSLLPVIMQGIEACSAYLMGRDVDGRRADMMAILTACRHALTSEECLPPADMAHAYDMLKAYDEQDEQESDFSRCLSHLLGYRVRVHNAGEMSIPDACILADSYDTETKASAERALKAVGMRWREDKGALQVDSREVMMKRIFAGTQWATGKVHNVLADGADAKSKTASPAGIWVEKARFPGTSTPLRCLFIPRCLVMGE